MQPIKANLIIEKVISELHKKAVSYSITSFQDTNKHYIAIIDHQPLPFCTGISIYPKKIVVHYRDKDNLPQETEQCKDFRQLKKLYPFKQTPQPKQSNQAK